MSDIKFKEVDHGIFDLLNWMRQRPWAFLDGDHSLVRVRSFLVGYECALAKLHFCMRDYERFKLFEEWMAAQLGFREPTSGWWNMANSKARNEEAGFNLFFELLDRFCRSQGIGYAS